MSKIIATIGISGSGKTTWAKEQVMNSDGKTVIVSKDKIREQLFGYSEQLLHEYTIDKHYFRNEALVKKTYERLVSMFLVEEMDVIVDETNLTHEELKNLELFGVPVQYKIFDLDVELCIRGASQVKVEVNEHLIRTQYKELKSLLRELKQTKNVIFKE